MIDLDPVASRAKGSLGVVGEHGERMADRRPVAADGPILGIGVLDDRALAHPAGSGQVLRRVGEPMGRHNITYLTHVA